MARGRDDERDDRTDAEPSAPARWPAAGGPGDHRARLGALETEDQNSPDRRDLRGRDYTPMRVEPPGRPTDGRGHAKVPTEGLLLPHGSEREIVTGADRSYRLSGPETDVLATVGIFGVVAERDLLAERSDPHAVRLALSRLAEDDLLERRSVVVNQAPVRVALLTRDGQTLLDRHRDPTRDDPEQTYRTGGTRPRDLAHDAQLYRLFQAEAPAIEQGGGRIVRIVLDADLAREYTLVRAWTDRPGAETDRASEAEAFARAQDLSIVDGRLQLPDVRIEYEWDGRLERRDLELITEHYSRRDVASKARAGLTLYRAVGHGGRRGGTPCDPHHLRRL